MGYDPDTDPGVVAALRRERALLEPYGHPDRVAAITAELVRLGAETPPPAAAPQPVTRRTTRSKA